MKKLQSRDREASTISDWRKESPSERTNVYDEEFSPEEDFSADFAPLAFSLDFVFVSARSSEFEAGRYRLVQ